jgi:hypothetical protein
MLLSVTTTKSAYDAKPVGDGVSGNSIEESFWSSGNGGRQWRPATRSNNLSQIICRSRKISPIMRARKYMKLGGKSSGLPSVDDGNKRTVDGSLDGSTAIESRR